MKKLILLIVIAGAMIILFLLGLTSCSGVKGCFGKRPLNDFNPPMWSNNVKTVK